MEVKSSESRERTRLHAAGVRCSAKRPWVRAEDILRPSEVYAYNRRSERAEGYILETTLTVGRDAGDCQRSVGQGPPTLDCIYRLSAAEEGDDGVRGDWPAIAGEL